MVGTAHAETYRADFEDIEIGEVPDDFLVLDGEFGVKEVDGNRVLELHPFPLSTFTLLLGPAETENVSIQAQFKADQQKKRTPVFGVGLSGIGGYRLQVNPAQERIELLREEIVEATATHLWKPGVWTTLRLRVIKDGEDGWRVEGKAWSEGEEEPSGWRVSYGETEEPLSGRPSLWGIPYSGKTIWFDEILITTDGRVD
jgi:hypothetical protein